MLLLPLGSFHCWGLACPRAGRPHMRWAGELPCRCMQPCMQSHRGRRRAPLTALWLLLLPLQGSGTRRTIIMSLVVVVLVVVGATVKGL